MPTTALLRTATRPNRLSRLLLPESSSALLFRAITTAFLIRMAVVALVFCSLPDPAHNFEQFGWELAWTARSIATGHGFSSPFFPLTGPTALVPPGYPYLLAAIFHLFGLFSLSSAFVILTLQSAVSALTCIPISFLAKSSTNTRLARFAAWAWVVYPFSIYYSTVVWEWALTAFLFTTCLALLFRLHTVDRTGIWIAFGLLYGLTALVNPAVLSVLPFLFVITLYRRARTHKPWLLKAAFTTLTVLAVLTPWTIRTCRTLHVLVPIRDNYWLEFYAGNTGDTFESNVAWVHPASSAAEMRSYAALGEVPYLAHKHALATDFVTHHPGWFAVATLRRFVRYWTGFWSFSRRYLHKEPLDVPNVFFCTAVTLFMVKGLYRLWRGNRTAAVPFATLLAVFPITYYLSHSSMDYRQPIEPAIIILAVIGFAGLKSGEESQRA